MPRQRAFEIGDTVKWKKFYLNTFKDSRWWKEKLKITNRLPNLISRNEPILVVDGKIELVSSFFLSEKQWKAAERRKNSTDKKEA